MDTSRIVGAEWAEKYPLHFPGRTAPPSAARFPCPICGHPTSDCTHEDMEALMAASKSTPKEKQAPPAPHEPVRRADGTDAATGAPPRRKVTPTSPGGSDRGTPVAPDGTVADGYEPLGETGAQNAHQMVAGGMPEASEALAPEVGEIDEAALLEKAFVPADNPHVVVATRTVLVEFTPARTQRKSTVQVFIKGQSFPRDIVTSRLAGYADHPDARLVYAD